MSDKKFLPLDEEFVTNSIHEGNSSELWNSRALVAPITLSTSFRLEGCDYSKGYSYSRWGNPSRDTLESCLASLEKAKHALCFSSGIGAVAAVTQLLKAGDHIICADDVYGGTRYLFSQVTVNNGIEVTFVDFTQQLSNFEDAIKSNTKLVWVESPSNPMLNVVDIPAVSKICKKRSDDILLGVDNTFLTPYFQRPLALGADLVMYSLTKYMNGHSDVIMGSVAVNDEKLYERMKFIQNFMGIIPSPFDCYLVTRSLKTLSVRMNRHMENCWKIIKHLQSHPQVEKVVHPALPDHPQHAVFMRQSSGYSGMIAFYIRGATIKHTIKFLESLKYIQFAGSLGSVESLAEAPCTLSHKKVPLEEKTRMGISENLVRLSVGLENTTQLARDIDQALTAAFLE